MTFVDRLGFYHDKPCHNGEPSSNNAWIYTAYAKAIGLKIPELRIIHYQYQLCYDRDAQDGFYFYRDPVKLEPPISRDEMIGMVSLLPNTVFTLLKHNFYLYDKSILKHYSYFEALCWGFKIRNKHRNFLWQNQVYPVYRLAFRLWHHDRYYMKKRSKIKPTVFETVCFYIYMIHSVIFANPGNKNLLWLQLHDMDSKYWIQLIDRKNNFLRYFGLQHIFNKGD